MPGCYEDARLVLYGEFSKLNSERVSSTEGGDDCARIVYRVDDVVYKIDGTRTGDNLVEYECLNDLHGDYEWAPPVSLFVVEGTPVLCMPYYRHYGEYDDPSIWDYLGDIEVTLESWHQMHGYHRDPDMHNGNYRVIAPGQVMVIDAAGGMSFLQA